MDEAAALARPAGCGSRTGRRSSATSSPGTRSSPAPSGTSTGLSWPEGIRYEDQPTTTRAFMAGTFDVAAPTSSTTGASATTAPRSPSSAPRSATSPTAGRPSGCRSPRSRAGGDPAVSRMFVDRVLAGDLWRYFLEIPGASRRVVDVAARRGAGVLGRAVAGAQRAAARAPALRLAGRAGPALGRRRADDVGRDSAPARRLRSATARADTSTYRAMCSICRRSTRPRSRCGTTRSADAHRIRHPGAPGQPAARSEQALLVRKSAPRPRASRGRRRSGR